MPNKKTHEPMFEPIVAAKRNFEIIEASIRREIYSGALVPGQKLPNEFELARQFNVGRSAVREALKVLELSGLLIVRRGYNGGTFVAPPDFEEASEAITLTFQPGHMALDQLLEACQTIESRAAELAASRASELEIDELEELVQRIEQCVHLPARYLTGIVDFHLSVTEMAHNSVFTLALQAMRINLIQELKMHYFSRTLQRKTSLHQKIRSGIPDLIESSSRSRCTRRIKSYTPGEILRSDSWARIS